MPLAVGAELPGKAGMEEVKGMQRGLVPRQWSDLRACLTCSPQRGSAGAHQVKPCVGASRCIREALIVRNLLAQKSHRGSWLPFSVRPRSGTPARTLPQHPHRAFSKALRGRVSCANGRRPSRGGVRGAHPSAATARSWCAGRQGPRVPVGVAASWWAASTARTPAGLHATGTPEPLPAGFASRLGLSLRAPVRARCHAAGLGRPP
jgi:hypothetical protein